MYITSFTRGCDSCSYLTGNFQYYIQIAHGLILLKKTCRKPGIIMPQSWTWLMTWILNTNFIWTGIAWLGAMIIIYYHGYILPSHSHRACRQICTRSGWNGNATVRQQMWSLDRFGIVLPWKNNMTMSKLTIWRCLPYSYRCVSFWVEIWTKSGCQSNFDMISQVPEVFFRVIDPQLEGYEKKNVETASLHKQVLVKPYTPQN